MNNEELKKKIIEIMSNVWSLPVPCTAERKFERIADALIAAGIGDVKDLQAQVDALEMTNIALQAGYDGAEKDRLYWVNKYKEAEHRAEVAERALYNACKHFCQFFVPCPDNDCKRIFCNKQKYGCYHEYFLQQAEKELAEDRKDG